MITETTIIFMTSQKLQYLNDISTEAFYCHYLRVSLV